MDEIKEMEKAKGEEKDAAYKIAMLGDSGVGKTALTYQFTTSEYICAYDLSLDDDYGQKTVSVLLNNQETNLEVVDHPACEMSVSAIDFLSQLMSFPFDWSLNCWAEGGRAFHTQSHAYCKAPSGTHEYQNNLFAISSFSSLHLHEKFMRLFLRRWKLSAQRTASTCL